MVMGKHVAPEMVRELVMFPHLLTLVPQSRKFLVRAENKELGWGGGEEEGGKAENLTDAPNTFQLSFRKGL